MSRNDAERRAADAERVRQAVQEQLEVHVRIADQGHAPSDDDRKRIAAKLPDLSAFGSASFHAVRAILDWDHQIPSQYTLLRILCCYDRETTERVDLRITTRDEQIDEANLYPEFDVPDYGEFEGSETYIAVLRPGTTEIEDFRFQSAWRKDVEPGTADLAARIVRLDENYQRAAAARQTTGLGGPVVIGWAPPCLAHTDGWAIEIWLLTEFDGQSGKARVFMVDLDEARVTRDFETDVQLA